MSKKYPIVYLSAPNLSGNELNYVKECLESGWVSDGKFISLLEERICRYTKVKYAVACVNGTSALLVCLRLLGVEENNEVIVPTLSFIAPVNAVKYLSAEPVFMDCDDFMNIDPGKLEEFCNNECRLTRSGLRNKRTGRIIKAVIAAHIFGNPCNLQRIMPIAKKYDLKVIEDAAESLGSSYTQGIYSRKFTGTIGNLGVYSFNGNKIVTTGGGGMIVTSDALAARKARYLVNQAKDDNVRYIHNEIGYNFRLTNIQAAVGAAQLEHLDAFIKHKKHNYQLFKKLLKPVRGLSMQDIPPGTSPNYWFYPLLIDKSSYGMDNLTLMQKLRSKGIETRPVWWLNHTQKPYKDNQSYKVTKACWFLDRVLNLPCSSNLSEDQLKRTVTFIKRWQRGYGKTK